MQTSLLDVVSYDMLRCLNSIKLVISRFNVPLTLEKFYFSFYFKTDVYYEQYLRH